MQHEFRGSSAPPTRGLRWPTLTMPDSPRRELHTDVTY
eukprot:COSAG06_NODE_58963_length_275_cov_1.176136_1_plen_37_part_10